MTVRTRIAITTAAACAAASIVPWKSLVAAAIPARAVNESRLVSIDNHKIFQAMNAYAWRIIVPDQKLHGMQSITLRGSPMGKNRPPIGKLDLNAVGVRREGGGLDLTLVIQPDALSFPDAKRIKTTLAAGTLMDSTWTSCTASFDRVQRTDAVAELANGSQLISFSDSKSGAELTLTLWLE